MPASFSESLADAVTAASSEVALGLRWRIRHSGVEPRDSFWPHLVVWCPVSDSRSICRVSPARPSLLVRRVWPGVGSQSLRSVCLSPLVPRGETSADQLEGIMGHPSQSLSSGFLWWDNQWRCSRTTPRLCRMCASRGHLFSSSTSSALGGGLVDFHYSPVHYCFAQCGGRLLHPSQSGHRVGMDPSSGGGGQMDCEMASGSRSVLDVSQLSSTSFFCSPQRSDVSRVRCIPSVVERDASVCIPSVCSHTGCFEQSAPVQRDFEHWSHLCGHRRSGIRICWSQQLLLQSSYRRGQIYSNNLTSIGFTSTTTCFSFTRGDCAVICKVFRPFT